MSLSQIKRLKLHRLNHHFFFDFGLSESPRQLYTLIQYSNLASSIQNLLLSQRAEESSLLGVANLGLAVFMISMNEFSLCELMLSLLVKGLAVLLSFIDY